MIDRKSASKICIFVLSKNRPDYLVEMLESIKSLSYKEFECVVMDNASTPDVISVIRNWMKCDSRFTISEWDAGHDGLENFQRAFMSGICDYEYFSIFHDDDIIDADWLSDAISLANATEQAAFVNVNAWMWDVDDITNCTKPWYPRMDGSLVISEHADVANWMLSVQHLHFPSTLYVTKNCKTVKFEWPFGKVSDGYFLAELAKNKPIVLSFRPAYYYRIHRNQDSASIPNEDVAGLIKYVVDNAKKSRHYSLVAKQKYLLKQFLHRSKLEKGIASRFGSLVKFSIEENWYPCSPWQFARAAYYLIDWRKA